SRALNISTAAITVVKNPPAWKAARGSNDKPIMTQKIASEPKPQARAAVAKAICRICSMMPPGTKRAPAAAILPRIRRQYHHKQVIAGEDSAPTAWAHSKPDAEEISHCRQGQEPGARKPDPQRGFGRILLGADPALVNGGGNASENDRGGRDHQ